MEVGVDGPIRGSCPVRFLLQATDFVFQELAALEHREAERTLWT